MEVELRVLVAGYSDSVRENAMKMRALLDSDRAVFPLAVARLFGDLGAERGCAHLITMLCGDDLLMPLFMDSSVPLSVCVAMVESAAEANPRFQSELTSLDLKTLVPGNEMTSGHVARLLEILSASLEVSTMWPLHRKILLHPDAKVRSRAMMVIGRSEAGVNAIERLLPDEDPRVRANALESLWLSDDPRAIPMFRKGLADPNNRVVGNAIVGLYKAGCSDAVPAALNLASHQDSTFRVTAAWLMGVTGDPQFIPVLGKLLGESTGRLRKSAFQALQSIKKINAERNRLSST